MSKKMLKILIGKTAKWALLECELNLTFNQLQIEELSKLKEPSNQ